MRTFVHMHGREGSDGLVDTIEGLGADVQELQLDGAMMLENKHFTNTRQAGCAPSIVLRQEVAVASRHDDAVRVVGELVLVNLLDGGCELGG